MTMTETRRSAGEPKPNKLDPAFDANGAVRLKRPEGGTPLRCWQCSKVIGVSFGFVGRIELYCKRCRRPNVFTGKTDDADVQKSRDVWLAQRVERLETIGFKEALAPSTEQLIELMEAKWKDSAKLRAQRSASLSVGTRFDVFHRDGFRCRYCGFSVEDGALLHVDHVIPQSKGGATSLDNLVTACLDCNIGKSAKDL